LFLKHPFTIRLSPKRICPRHKHRGLQPWIFITSTRPCKSPLRTNSENTYILPNTGRVLTEYRKTSRTTPATQSSSCTLQGPRMWRWRSLCSARQMAYRSRHIIMTTALAVISRSRCFNVPKTKERRKEEGERLRALIFSRRVLLIFNLTLGSAS